MRRKVVLAVAGLLLVFVGGCTVETVHNFIWFGARAKQSEARTNLRLLCQAQRALLEQGKPTTRFVELGVEIEHGNRYAYFFSLDGPLQQQPFGSTPVVRVDDAVGMQVDARTVPHVLPTANDVPKTLLGGAPPGVSGACPQCTGVMVAVGSIDVDDELDVWSVSTAARTAPDGTVVEPCRPFLEHSDLPPGPVRRLLSLGR